MIIYGRRSSHLKTVQLTHESCSHCGTQGSITLSTYARYAHIFWIPVFSIGRTAVSQCEHCKQVLKTEEMPPSIKSHYKQMLAETRIPLWQFSGLALLGIFIAWFSYSNSLDKEGERQFLTNPMAGDTYQIKEDNGNYTLFKVTAVAPDTLWVRFNDYEVNKITGIYKIDKEENYADYEIGISRNEIVDMYNAKKVIDISR